MTSSVPNCCFLSSIHLTCLRVLRHCESKDGGRSGAETASSAFRFHGCPGIPSEALRSMVETSSWKSGNRFPASWASAIEALKHVLRRTLEHLSADCRGHCVFFRRPFPALGRLHADVPVDFESSRVISFRTWKVDTPACLLAGRGKRVSF